MSLTANFGQETCSLSSGFLPGGSLASPRLDPSTCEQFQRPFLTASEESADSVSFDLGVDRLQAVHRDHRTVVALAHGRRRGVIACYLGASMGMLLVDFGRETLPQVLLPRVTAICDRIWATAPL